MVIVLQALASADVNTTEPSQTNSTKTLHPTPTPLDTTTQGPTQTPASSPTQPPKKTEDVPPGQSKNSTHQSEEPTQQQQPTSSISAEPAAQKPKPSSAPSGHKASLDESTPLLPQPQPLRVPQGRALPRREDPAPRKRSLLPNRRGQGRPQQYSGSGSSPQASNGPRGHAGSGQNAQGGKVRCHYFQVGDMKQYLI